MLPRPHKWHVVPTCADRSETCQKCRADIWQKKCHSKLPNDILMKTLRRHFVVPTWTTCRQYVVKDILMTCRQNVMSITCHWWHFDDISSKCHVSNISLKIFWRHSSKWCLNLPNDMLPKTLQRYFQDMLAPTCLVVIILIVVRALSTLKNKQK